MYTCKELCDIEIVVVNDGSTDNTPQIVEEYQSKYPFIKLLNKQNGGVSSARNEGIRICNGEYIAFLDADDSYVEGALDILLSILLEHSPDIVQCRVFTPKKSDDRLAKNENDITFSGNVERYYTNQTCSSSVFSKVVKRELLENPSLAFTNKLTIGEDVIWTLHLLNSYPEAQLLVTNLSLVRYNYNPNSVLNTTDKDRLLKNLNAYIDYYEALQYERGVVRDYLLKSIDRATRICKRGIITRHLSVLMSNKDNSNYSNQFCQLQIMPLSGTDRFSRLINQAYDGGLWRVKLLQAAYSFIVRLNLRKYLIR